MISSRKAGIALVTGANRGIGLELARQLARHGFTTVLGSRDAEKGRAAARASPPTASASNRDDWTLTTTTASASWPLSSKPSTGGSTCS